MQREEDVTTTPKVYRLIVDKEELIERVKTMVGITHHMTDDHFFNCLESIAREFPDPKNVPVKPPFVETEASKDFDDTLPELPEHVMTSLQLVRKRRCLTLDLHRLMEHWPAGVEGHPTILVVSNTDAADGYVNRVPEALNFMVDAVLQIRNGETALLRQQNGVTIYDNMLDTFPFNRSNRFTLR